MLITVATIPSVVVVGGGVVVVVVVDVVDVVVATNVITADLVQRLVQGPLIQWARAQDPRALGGPPSD